MAAAATVSRATGASSALLDGTGFHVKCERRIRQELSALEFETAWSKGGSLSFDEAVIAALSKTTVIESAGY